jgi:hypothetical protein
MHTPRPHLSNDFLAAVTDYVIGGCDVLVTKEPLELFIGRLCFLFEDEAERLVVRERERAATVITPSTN